MTYNKRSDMINIEENIIFSEDKMKVNQIKKLTSWLLVTAMVCALFFGVALPTSAESYIYNWGARGDTCTELSSHAKEFYTGIYVFEDMSQTKGGTSQSNAPGSALY